MKKIIYSVLVLAVFTIGFTASDETEKSNGSEQKETTVNENKQEESQPKEDSDVQHFVGDYFYSYFTGNTNAKMYFKLSLKADGSFTLEPTNQQTKDWINMEKVMDGNDFPENGDWKVKNTPAGKGAFLDFDGSWGDGTITYDRKVLEISNMNGYKLKTELSYKEAKTLSKGPDSPENLIRYFYQSYVFGDKETNDDILDTYLSAEMKKSLWTDDYDGCYEFWRFRTTAQDYNESVGNISKVKAIQSSGGGWYVVTYLDMGFEGKTKVKVLNGKIVEFKPDKSWESWDD